jgi:dTDP-4-amino-4,6-dideoxygalactose transaminase
VKERGAWVVEDACQALLSSHVGTSSDFVFFSLVKWIGAPDGGILRFPESISIEGFSLEAPATTWWLKALQASVLRREFDDGLPTRELWFKLFRETDYTMPTGPYAMSDLSETIMKHSVDYSIIEERRVENYRALLERLAAYAIFPRIEPSVIPLGFPVRVANRDAIRQRLFDHQIYPPVHWLIDGVVPRKYEDSHRLAGEIMTLPCDQRYSVKDMERMAEVFLQDSPQNG